MRIITKVAATVQSLVHAMAEDVAKECPIVLRRRKFSTATLAQTFILQFLCQTTRPPTKTSRRWPLLSGSRSPLRPSNNDIPHDWRISSKPFSDGPAKISSSPQSSWRVTGAIHGRAASGQYDRHLARRLAATFPHRLRWHSWRRPGRDETASPVGSPQRHSMRSPSNPDATATTKRAPIAAIDPGFAADYRPRLLRHRGFRAF